MSDIPLYAMWILTAPPCMAALLACCIFLYERWWHPTPDQYYHRNFVKKFHAIKNHYHCCTDPNIKANAAEIKKCRDMARFIVLTGMLASDRDDFVAFAHHKLEVLHNHKDKKRALDELSKKSN